MKNQTHRWVVVLLISLLVALGQKYGWLDTSGLTLGVSQPGLYRVIEVFDGDTIGVDMNGREEKIRLIGVDTPETHDPRKDVQCFGQAATEFTKQLIGNSSVRLAVDPLSTNRDRYNRLLRYVYLPDGRLVNLEIITAGYGFAYLSFPITKNSEFAQAETQARESGRGLWSACQVNLDSRGFINSGSEIDGERN